MDVTIDPQAVLALARRCADDVHAYLTFIGD
jgi:hypothetical protein